MGSSDELRGGAAINQLRRISLPVTPDRQVYESLTAAKVNLAPGEPYNNTFINYHNYNPGHYRSSVRSGPSCGDQAIATIPVGSEKGLTRTKGANYVRAASFSCRLSEGRSSSRFCCSFSGQDHVFAFARTLSADEYLSRRNARLAGECQMALNFGRKS